MSSSRAKGLNMLCFYGNISKNGSETWTVIARDAKRITAAEMKCMRITAGYTPRVYKTNTQIAKELKITPILDKFLEYKWKWTQHVNRMPRNRLPRVMKHYSPTGIRNRGRLLKILLDTRDRNGSTSGPTPWQIYVWWWWWWWWWKYEKHMFCGHNILTEGVFVTQLSRDSWVLVWRSVLVMANWMIYKNPWRNIP